MSEPKFCVATYARRARLIGSRTLLCSATLVAVAACSDESTGPASGIIYENDFNSGLAGSEWSSDRITVSPSGERFLGGFGGSPTLTLINLPAHDRVTVEFDLHIIDSWNGRTDDFVTVTSTTETLLHASFSNAHDHWQSYPASLGEAENEAVTDNHTTGLLGYERDGDWYDYADSTYRLTLTTPHTGGTFSLTFASSVSSSSNEQFGIDNMRVTVD